MAPDRNSFASETRVQAQWAAAKVFESDPVPGRLKWFVVELPPFANGRLHLGHLRNYAIGDVIARFRRMAGYNVYYTIGFDAFGLPNENAALEEGCTPQELVERNIAAMRAEFRRLGLSYDWRHVVSDHEPRFYRWVQWIFLKLFEAGHIYRSNGPVNWCPSCRSTLTESLVEAGRCWRCATPVVLTEMDRWFVRESDFVAPLLQAEDHLPDWPDVVKSIHRDWIGRRDGVDIDFRIAGRDTSITTFTSEPDLLKDVAFLAVGPLHALAAGAADGRVVDLGIAAIEPLSGRLLPVLLLRDDERVQNGEVLMGCPAREPRDRAICPSEATDAAQPSASTADSEATRDRILASLLASGAGRATTRYRLRDWDIARPRYWGTPVPVVHCAACGPVPAQSCDLPVLLPQVVDLSAAGSPLESSREFVEVPCPRCGAPARRDTDTIETYACPWWFYITCKDPNSESPFDPESRACWMPVDVMIGGSDQIRTCFFHLRTLAEAMTRLGIVDERHPVKRLMVIGMVKQDGRKMSKSAGNAVDLATLLDRHGADVLRLAILSSAAPDQDINWSDDLIRRGERFVRELARFFDRHEFAFATLPQAPPRDNATQRKLANWIATAERKITGCLVRYAFHLAIQQLTVLVEQIKKFEQDMKPDDKAALAAAARSILQLAAPIVPHVAEELWERAGGQGLLAAAQWPSKIADAIPAVSTQSSGRQ